MVPRRLYLHSIYREAIDQARGLSRENASTRHGCGRDGGDGWRERRRLSAGNGGRVIAFACPRPDANSMTTHSPQARLYCEPERRRYRNEDADLIIHCGLDTGESNS
jgi:hypothetical protein